MPTLDDVIELVNAEIDRIETILGIIDIRTTSIQEYLYILDNIIDGMKYAISTKDNINYIIRFIAYGLCCLEQYTNIIEDSCPWEYDYSYDDPRPILDYMRDIKNEIIMALIIIDEPDDFKNLKVLYKIKSSVIYAISLLLTNLLIKKDLYK